MSIFNNLGFYILIIGIIALIIGLIGYFATSKPTALWVWITIIVGVLFTTIGLILFLYYTFYVPNITPISTVTTTPLSTIPSAIPVQTSQTMGSAQAYVVSQGGKPKAIAVSNAPQTIMSSAPIPVSVAPQPVFSSAPISVAPQPVVSGCPRSDMSCPRPDMSCLSPYTPTFVIQNYPGAQQVAEAVKPVSPPIRKAVVTMQGDEEISRVPIVGGTGIVIPPSGPVVPAALAIPSSSVVASGTVGRKSLVDRGGYFEEVLI
jgi:hypothetical protein